MKFSTIYFTEDVDSKATAYWLSPSRDILPIDTSHIDTIVADPERFNLTQEYLNDVAEKHGGRHELRDGGKGREEVMVDLMKKGWVRIRKNRETWIIQLDAPSLNGKINRTQKKAITNWAEQMINMNDNRKRDTVVVMDLKGNKLFGGGMLYKDQKTIQDIYLDDSGVFESIVIDETTSINESSLSRVWTHNTEHDCGALTAYRRGRDCGSGERYTRKENQARNKSLLSKLQSMGYDTTTLKGQYPESGVVLKEVSFFVVDSNDKGTLENDLKKLGEEFDQDSILFIPKGAINNEGDKAYLIGTNHCENNWLGYGKTDVFNKGKIGVESPIYTSYVNGRPFIFESVDKVNSIPASGMGMWSLHRASQKHWKEFL